MNILLKIAVLTNILLTTKFHHTKEGQCCHGNAIKHHAIFIELRDLLKYCEDIPVIKDTQLYNRGLLVLSAYRQHRLKWMAYNIGMDVPRVTASNR
jgi:hypothetical protein